jgi:hypothetical protein
MASQTLAMQVGKPTSFFIDRLLIDLGRDWCSDAFGILDDDDGPDPPAFNIEGVCWFYEG